MFDKKRYITTGIYKTIPSYFKKFIWDFINNMDGIEQDYLQVFELSSENNVQKVTHSQERPKYKREYLVYNTPHSPIKAKIFVVDSGEYCTMMLAEEY